MTSAVGSDTVVDVDIDERAMRATVREPPLTRAGPKSRARERTLDADLDLRFDKQLWFPARLRVGGVELFEEGRSAGRSIGSFAGTLPPAVPPSRAREGAWIDLAPVEFAVLGLRTLQEARYCGRSGVSMDYGGRLTMVRTGEQMSVSWLAEGALAPLSGAENAAVLHSAWLACSEHVRRHFLNVFPGLVHHKEWGHWFAGGPDYLRWRDYH